MHITKKEEEKYDDQTELTNGKTIEVSAQGVMSLMEQSYLEGKTRTAVHMRRLLFTASICIANVSNGISPEEIATFAVFLAKVRSITT